MSFFLNESELRSYQEVQSNARSFRSYGATYYASDQDEIVSKYRNDVWIRKFDFLAKAAEELYRRQCVETVEKYKRVLDHSGPMSTFGMKIYLIGVKNIQVSSTSWSGLLVTMTPRPTMG